MEPYIFLINLILTGYLNYFSVIKSHSVFKKYLRMILFSLKQYFFKAVYNFNFLHQAFFQIDHFIFKI